MGFLCRCDAGHGPMRVLSFGSPFSWRDHWAARVHHAPRRHGGRVAARGARAADGQCWWIGSAPET
jgi:hypothetical protein